VAARVFWCQDKLRRVTGRSGPLGNGVSRLHDHCVQYVSVVQRREADHDHAKSPALQPRAMRELRAGGDGLAAHLCDGSSIGIAAAIAVGLISIVLAMRIFEVRPRSIEPSTGPAQGVQTKPTVVAKHDAAASGPGGCMSPP